LNSRSQNFFTARPTSRRAAITSLIVRTSGRSCPPSLSEHSQKHDQPHRPRPAQYLLRIFKSVDDTNGRCTFMSSVSQACQGEYHAKTHRPSICPGRGHDPLPGRRRAVEPSSCADGRTRCCTSWCWRRACLCPSHRSSTFAILATASPAELAALGFASAAMERLGAILELAKRYSEHEFRSAWRFAAPPISTRTSAKAGP
jgi:hypothetical protein